MRVLAATLWVACRCAKGVACRCAKGAECFELKDQVIQESVTLSPTVSLPDPVTLA